MRPDSYFVPYAEAAYNDYGGVTDHKNYQGLPMPEWKDLTPKIQAAWVAAVKSTFRILSVSSVEHGQFVETTADQAIADAVVRQKSHETQ